MAKAPQRSRKLRPLSSSPGRRVDPRSRWPPNPSPKVGAACGGTTLGFKWEFISASTPAAVASLNLTNLAAYRVLKLEGNLLPATDAVSLWLRTDTNNGASFDAGATDYDYSGLVAGEGSTGAGTFSNGDTKIVLAGTSVGNAAGEGCSFSILLFNFNQALHMHMVATVLNMRDNGRPYTFTVTGRRIQATARDAVQLLFSSGNIASGHVILEGAR